MRTIIYIRTSNIYDDSRATKEILALLEKGYRVICLGWNRDGEAEERSTRLFQNDNAQLELRFFQARVEGGIGLKNIRLLWAWLKWTKRQVKKIKGIDAIHACNLDAAMNIWRYAISHKIKLIYDIYDYYVDSHNIPILLRGIIEKKEVHVINKADLTIICTEERKAQIVKANPNKLIVIHNSPEVNKVEEETEIYDYVYCGSLFQGRLLGQIFENYNINTDLKFCIAGYGQYKEAATELTDKYQNFHYFGALSYEEVLEKEKQSKIISAIYEPSIRNHKLCAPNKFYEALALAKPVIVCRGTGIDRVVEKNNIGIVINYKVDDFYSAVRTLKDNAYLRQQMGIRARHLYEKEFKWEIMKNRLLDAYCSIWNKK
ncbi:MAG: glycosyltransferase [Paludibacteraceae bacterium]|nr:glycosyltransferase [Paludibacteraceae bacterium]